MPKVALTATLVEKRKAPETGQIDYFDKGHAGLALRISYGGRRSFVYIYRLRGKLHRLTLGSFPTMSLADAREAWRNASAKVAEGIDPRPQPTEAQQPDTVRVVGERFVAKYARPRNRTADEVERMFELHLYPALGDRDIGSVTRRDILDVLDSIEEKVSGARANRVLANIRRLFAWAVERGVIEVSPVANVKAPGEERARDRVLSDDELRAFRRACDRLGEPFGPLFRLLALTGQRRDEVASAPWSEVGLGDALWRLPGSRVKNGRAHDVPLAKQAVELITGLPSKGKSPLLFPAQYARPPRKGEAAERVAKEARSVSGFAVAKARLDRLMLEELGRLAEKRGDAPEKVTLPDWRLHDLRRTAASGMARLGIGVHVVEKLLNHVSGTFAGIVGVYQRHEFADEKRAAAQTWANFLDGLTDEKPSNVVTLAEAR